MERLLALAVAVAAPLATAAGASYDPAPWLADLQQARTALSEKYANLEWLTDERRVDVDALFADTAARLRSAGNDAAARAALDRMVRRIHDGHVELVWPSAGGATSTPSTLCGRLGYDARQASPGLASSLDGYRPLDAAEGVFPIGLLAVGGRTVGVVRIGIFQVQGYPALCEQAVAALRVSRGAPCDEACSDRIVGWAYGRLTAGLEGELRRLRAAGADVLLVDVTDNGGGSQWVEAAARILSRRPLTSSKLGFLRSTHWAEEWSEKAEKLRHAAAGAPEPERAHLLAWANEAADAARVAATRCPARGPCERLGRAGFATGLVGSAPAGTFAGKPWGPLVFTPAQYEYHDGVFGGPVVVLTDDETWSAAEELTAELQDNRAAVVLGARTGGAGCGHTGEPPTKLTNSGAVLELPDCARFRADDSNEVSGVVPDVLVGLRAYDGKRYQARLVGAKLEEAVGRAVALDAR